LLGAGPWRCDVAGSSSGLFNGLSGPPPGLTTVDDDSFSFTVPAGDIVTSINYVFTPTSVSGLGTVISSFGLDASGDVGGVFFGLGASTSPLSFFGAEIPLAAGTHTVQNFFIFAGPLETATWDYTWTFAVGPAPVPEPSTLVLVGTALIGGLLAWRVTRRRKGLRAELAAG